VVNQQPPNQLLLTMPVIMLGNNVGFSIIPLQVSFDLLFIHGRTANALFHPAGGLVVSNLRLHSTHTRGDEGDREEQSGLVELHDGSGGRCYRGVLAARILLGDRDRQRAMGWIGLEAGGIPDT
jgi:hypothetical protein